MAKRLKTSTRATEPLRKMTNKMDTPIERMRKMSSMITQLILTDPLRYKRYPMLIMTQTLFQLINNVSKWEVTTERKNSSVTSARRVGTSICIRSPMACQIKTDSSSRWAALVGRPRGRWLVRDSMPATKAVEVLWEDQSSSKRRTNSCRAHWMIDLLEARKVPPVQAITPASSSSIDHPNNSFKLEIWMDRVICQMSTESNSQGRATGSEWWPVQTPISSATWEVTATSLWRTMQVLPMQMWIEVRALLWSTEATFNIQM